MRLRGTGARSLRADLLIAALVPLLVFTLGAAGTFWRIAESQLESRVQAKLSTVAAFLIEASELGLLTQAPDSLREPIQRVLADEDVVHVSVYNPRGELLISEGEVVGPLLPREDLFPTQTGPEYRALGSTLQELRQVVRHRAARTGNATPFVSSSETGAELGELRGYVRIVMSNERVRAEYGEMPGLRLTVPQAARLFGVAPDVAHAVLDHLRRASVLNRSERGTYALTQ